MTLQANGMTDYVVVKSGWDCNLCNEGMYAITWVTCKVSPAGERFYFRSPYPLANFCARCQSVSIYQTGGGNETHVDRWDPLTWVDLRTHYKRQIESLGPKEPKPPVIINVIAEDAS
jgi:hypothetical protein